MGDIWEAIAKLVDSPGERVRNKVPQDSIPQKVADHRFSPEQ